MTSAHVSHSDPAITLRVYAHLSSQHAEGVAAKFAQGVDGELDLD